MKEKNIGSKAKAHHYLSQCYLKGFSDLENKFLIPIDLQSRRVLPASNSRNLAQETYFNRVDIDGLPPNYVEDFLAIELEGKVATAIRNIENSFKFEGEDREVILNLMTLFAIRNPIRRKQQNHMVNHMSKMVLSIAAQNVGGISNGVKITPDIKRLIDEGAYKIELTRNEHIRSEMMLFNELLPCFFDRKWILIQASDNTQFVTSDFPVILIWKEPHKHNLSPGFGLRGTQVHFPLSKKIALIGDFDGVEGSLIEPKEIVALINSNILAHAQRWVFTANQDFYFLNQSGECLFGIEKYWKFLNRF
ncbi:DUF4238 domain-containing protein [Fluoribacter gormanii]|uniref:DUF4238 domain-containing protein n=1 Tax=Fluoribacter gormanii TaxID=464 RepID=UPI002243261B|nr:DUF4238 domain-containing protein [Fluoribacter gormanii]MCW8445678.1 DUF4238 domain-containing protein [Fluoribacter gormanii]